MPRNSCYYCERTFSRISIGEFSDGSIVLRTRDHIIPKSKGGINGDKNIVISCEKCNRLKGNKLPEEFLIFLETSVNKHSYHGYKKANYLLIIHNTVRLIEKIKDYRHELSTIAQPQISTTIEKVVSVIKASPASKVQEMNQQIFVKRFARTYPYIYDILLETNPDLPRWIYDNALKLATP